jgi:predicted O-linked N-acetylglucosamine transferase (SPINDLY family)
MMAEYADVDIALDPVPYNGGTTTLQTLWMGVPVLVKAGNNFVSRMGASFVQAPGWNIDPYTRDFEQGLRMAWQDYCKLK